MNATEKRARFRDAIASGKPVLLAGAHNGLSARLVEEAGFDCIWASGLEVSASYALPDNSILSMNEFLRAAYEMDRASDLPVIADCDTGFGGTENVIHLVREYERHGIAGICIEDKVFPKSNSFSGRMQELVAIEEFVAKIRAARAARSDDKFVIIARTEVFIAGGTVTEALERAQAYESAGADALVIHSKRSDTNELVAFAREYRGKLPLVSIPTTYPNVSAAELANLGYRIVIFANHGLRAALRSMRETLSHLRRASTAAAVEPNVASVADVFELQRVRSWTRARDAAYGEATASAAATSPRRDS
jgi:phosphoenolpyruvate phosphomutase